MADTELAELPANLLEYLDAIEDDLEGTDYCLETFEHLYDLATTNTTIPFDVLLDFLKVCTGG
jgi:hypothetical protein